MLRNVVILDATNITEPVTNPSNEKAGVPLLPSVGQSIRGTENPRRC